MANFLKVWLSQSDVGQSRTSTVNPLQWGLVVLVGGIGFLRMVRADQWVIVFLVVLTSIDFLLFAIAYLYFMLKNPDALRSEHYSLSKLAIEKGLIGDSIHGLFEAAPVVPQTSKSVRDLQKEQE